MRKIIASLFLGILMMTALAAPAIAISITKPDFLPGPSEEVSGSDTQDYILNTTIPRAMNIVTGLLGIAAFLAILISAIQMLTAYGNEDKVTKAKTNLKYAVFGFILIILSYAIVSIIVAVSLPSDEDSSALSLIPTAYAVDTEDDINVLLPSQHDLIESQDEQGRVSLPSGNLVSEIVPALVTNLFYLIGFLIFIAFMYGGVLLVIGRGNEDMTTKAKSIVVYSAIALAVIAVGYAMIFGIASLNLSQDTTSESDDVFTDTTTE